MKTPVSKVINKRLQASLINHLEKHGTIQINLPDNFILEIGITEEDENAKIDKNDQYCYVIVKNESRATVIDKYNLGLRFSDDLNSIVMDDKFVDHDGKNIKTINVV